MAIRIEISKFLGWHHLSPPPPTALNLGPTKFSSAELRLSRKSLMKQCIWEARGFS